MAKNKKRRRHISIVKNLHFRELESWRYCERLLTPEFRLFVKSEIWPLLKELHKGYKLKDKQEITAHVADNLIEAGLTEKVVADSRDYNNKKVRKSKRGTFTKKG